MFLARSLFLMSIISFYFNSAHVICTYSRTLYNLHEKECIIQTCYLNMHWTTGETVGLGLQHPTGSKAYQWRVCQQCSTVLVHPSWLKCRCSRCIFRLYLPFKLWLAAYNLLCLCLSKAKFGMQLLCSSCSVTENIALLLQGLPLFLVSCLRSIFMWLPPCEGAVDRLQPACHTVYTTLDTFYCHKGFSAT